IRLMSPPHARSLLHWFDLACLGVLMSLLALVAWLPGQETATTGQAANESKAESKDRDQRLEAIEKSLQALLKEVQSLQKPEAQARGATADTPSSASASSAPSSSKTPASFELDAKWLKSLNW